ncbi:MAG: RDD family protein [Pyrinomonadaceae bacterium]
MNTSTCPESATTDAPADSLNASASGATSTLIEFPVAGRVSRPQWRKDLSERVREIQQRRALDAAREAEEAEREGVAQATATDGREATTQPLGLVPPPEPQELNPIVAKALERIERVRQQQQQSYATTRQPSARGGAATAAATRPTEEAYHAPQPREAHAASGHLATGDAATATRDQSVAENIEKPVEPVRTTNLVVVPPPAPPVGAVTLGSVSEADTLIKEALSRPRPRRHLDEVADDALLTRLEAEVMPHAPDPVVEAKDVPSLPRRVVGGVIDLLVVAFATSPFAAIIELTNGNWHDPRVAGSLAGVVLVIMFVYLTASVALAGRTWGMGLVSLRAVDERSGLIPTAGQCARRAVVYILSLATLGLGLLPALFGSEGRAAHDRLSRTCVVHEE